MLQCVHFLAFLLLFLSSGCGGCGGGRRTCQARCKYVMACARRRPTALAGDATAVQVQFLVGMHLLTAAPAARLPHRLVFVTLIFAL